MSKTKWKLAESLKKVMKTKHLRKITIQDIVEESGMTRQSFYYHFHDIFEIIEWMCKNDLLKKCVVDKKSPEAWIYMIFRNMSVETFFYKKVVHEFGREVIEKTLEPEIESRMQEVMAIYMIEENEILSFLTKSLLNYLIIMVDNQGDEMSDVHIESVILFLKNGIGNYNSSRKNVLYA